MLAALKFYYKLNCKFFSIGCALSSTVAFSLVGTDALFFIFLVFFVLRLFTANYFESDVAVLLCLFVLSVKDDDLALGKTTNQLLLRH